MSGVATITTVSAVHEQVHEWTQKERQLDQRTQNVSAVLGEQKRTGNDEKAEQDEPSSRSQKTSLRLISIVRMIMKRHAVLLFNDETSAEHAHRTCKSEFARFLRQEFDCHGQLRSSRGLLARR